MSDQAVLLPKWFSHAIKVWPLRRLDPRNQFRTHRIWQLYLISEVLLWLWLLTFSSPTSQCGSLTVLLKFFLKHEQSHRFITWMISQLRVWIKYAPTLSTNIWIIFVAIFRAVGTGEARASPLLPNFAIKKGNRGNRGKKGQSTTIVPSQIFGYSEVPDIIDYS